MIAPRICSWQQMGPNKTPHACRTPHPLLSDGDRWCSGGRTRDGEPPGYTGGLQKCRGLQQAASPCYLPRCTRRMHLPVYHILLFTNGIGLLLDFDLLSDYTNFMVELIFNRRVAIPTSVALLVILSIIAILSDAAAPLNTVYKINRSEISSISLGESKSDVIGRLGEPFDRLEFERGDSCWLYSHGRNGLMRWESIRVCFNSLGFVTAAGSTVY